MPNEHYGFDLNYSYNDVYMATNGCFQGAATVMPGGTTCLAPQSRPARFAARLRHGHGSAIFVGPGQGFRGRSDAVRIGGLRLSPDHQAPLQYRLPHQLCERQPASSPMPQDVNGSLVSTYQTPFRESRLDSCTRD